LIERPRHGRSADGECPVDDPVYDLTARSAEHPRGTGQGNRNRQRRDAETGCRGVDGNSRAQMAMRSAGPRSLAAAGIDASVRIK